MNANGYRTGWSPARQSSTDIGCTLGTPLTTVSDPGGLNLTSTAVYNMNPSLYGGVKPDLAVTAYDTR